MHFIAMIVLQLALNALSCAFLPAALPALQGDAAFKHCRSYLPQKNWGALEQDRHAINSTLPFLGRPGGTATSTPGPSGTERPLLLCSGCGMRSLQLNKCAACKQAAYCR
jgi:hypothetical protein